MRQNHSKYWAGYPIRLSTGTMVTFLVREYIFTGSRGPSPAGTSDNSRESMRQDPHTNSSPKPKPQA
ncbi:hypothetical protein BofuT4_uP005220.1 [Botrytis cinerea T4]|uniref:Uncharacterized protein n=1 Tax=Botryotinia fuckeliana (strain T4) TaxID=999810 RepID=G2Y3X3_BOTF4|nr:hypothetical protein BofuT4_uP005220.1 [Botrytis cinerea T4]